MKMSKTLQEKIEEALAAIEGINFDEAELGKHVINDDIFLLLQKYDSKDPKEARFETHNNYLDIQYVVKGKECLEIAPKTIMEVTESYDPERDVEFYKDVEDATKIVLTDGAYVIIYPTDAHKPGMYVGRPSEVKKIVAKIRI